ncbi:type II toxin-antitoxin system HicA family toxin [Rhodospirillales bacterium]|nr:type II toxin-antitoxin system HicA family toxin [Rhodospirillales bacterium]
MKPKNIDALQDHLPDVFNRKSLPEDWDDDVIVIPVDQLDDDNPIDETLYPDFEDDPLTDPSQIPEILDGVLSYPDDFPPVSYDEVSGVADDLRGKIGGDFPGSPGGLVGAPVPSTDTLGFYLPWHEFNTDDWGIYVIGEGIDSLGKDIHQITRGYLTLSQSCRIAKGFIFHHEAFHNVVETFAAQTEISHRTPCYISGFRKLYKTGFAKGLMHEEGMANAYSYAKIDTGAFKNIKDLSIRRAKKQLALHALRIIIQRSPPPYDTAAKLLKRAPFKKTRNQFQEEALQTSLPSLIGLPPDAWEVALFSMSPSLRRNGHFTYVISRNSKLAHRSKLSVFYLKRRPFLKQLGKVTGGQEITAGGKHPRKWVTPGGWKVPLPYHGKEIARGTAQKILKDLGVSGRLDDFMNL